MDRLAEDEGRRQTAKKSEQRTAKEVARSERSPRLQKATRASVYNKIAACNRKAVAKRAGLDISTVSKIVTGSRCPSMQSAILIAKELNLQPGDIIEYSQWLQKKPERMKRAKKPQGRKQHEPQ